MDLGAKSVREHTVVVQTAGVNSEAEALEKRLRRVQIITRQNRDEPLVHGGRLRPLPLLDAAHLGRQFDRDAIHVDLRFGVRQPRRACRARQNSAGSALLYRFDLVVAQHPHMGWQRNKIGVRKALRIRFVGRDRP